MQASLSRTLLIGLLLVPGVAAADLLPPPGARERAFAEEVQQAGFPCPDVVSLTELADATAGSYAARGLVAYKVACNDGHVYLVANPPRRHGYQPNAPPQPAPVVEEWKED